MTHARGLLTSTHWGTYHVETKGGRVTALRAFDHDPDPSPIGPGIVDVLDGPTRITEPMIRKSWLEHGPGAAGEKRGTDEFVAVSWDKAVELVAGELTRLKRDYGNQSIYAGSYGWASAGRFHHAQSQMKRFLNCIGGFTSSKNTYSFAAAEVVVPHVLGNFREHLDQTTSWDSIAEDCELFVAFGGVPVKNGQINAGGVGAHIQKSSLRDAAKAGVEFVNISPLRSDVMEEVAADWMAIRPSTDAALMLALAHTLLAEGLFDQTFLDRYTVGFAEFSAYLSGASDGVVKTADWAAPISDIPAEDIRALARKMAAKKTMISVAWALTRQDHGEQPFWGAIALAAMLGQIGLPGTGVGFGYSAENYVGQKRVSVPYASFPTGQNPVAEFIPVARVCDMLERPGDPFDYNGKTYTYPDVKLIWWAGGNPFHHHQDLNRLQKAWARPDTIIANEWCWNALARRADIVLPCTTPLERSDLALTPKDDHAVVMDKAMEPVGSARDDHEIFRLIARKMGVEEAFTEGRSPAEWQRWIYDVSRQQAARVGVELPEWDRFHRDGWYKTAAPPRPTVMMEEFRADPDANPLSTPSGKIEIFSGTIDGFGYGDCPGHPVWREPLEWLGDAPDGAFHLISNQPRNKLHSQLDHGAVSLADRPKGVERVSMHPADATRVGLSEGAVVRLHNVRGACLGELVLDDTLKPGVLQMATGAWWDADGTTCKRGNPNVLTPDKGTSRLAQGPIAHSCLVFVEAAPPS